VYLIFLLIDAFSLAPVTGANYPDRSVSPGKADCQYSTADLSETEIAPFAGAMGTIHRHNTLRVCECMLCKIERDAMLDLVQQILPGTPFKASLADVYSKNMAICTY
jgi:hypothetical protein